GGRGRGDDRVRGPALGGTGGAGGRTVPAGGAAGGRLPGGVERHLLRGAVPLCRLPRNAGRFPRRGPGARVRAEGLRLWSRLKPRPTGLHPATGSPKPPLQRDPGRVSAGAASAATHAASTAHTGSRPPSTATTVPVV